MPPNEVGDRRGYECSEGCDLTDIRGYEDRHLDRAHHIATIWVCECTDVAYHGRGRYGANSCGNYMGNDDANIDARGHDPYDGYVLDMEFPYIYVCPDCRAHDHGRERRTR